MPILNCGNNARDYLRPFGYGTLALPKAGVQPLTLLAKRGDRLAPIGALGVSFPSTAVALPAMTSNRTANLSGAASSNISASVGLDILGSVIGALSGSTLGIKAAYRDARTIKFEFSDVMETKIDINALDRYLSKVEVDPDIGPFLREALEDDDIYVIVAVVDAKQIAVDATRDGGASLDLEVPVVQGLVGGKVAVSGAGTSSSVLRYETTETPLVFGAQVIRLVFRDGLYQTLKIVKADQTHLASAGQEIFNDTGAEDDTAIIVPAELIAF
jgi:hypothetical protein